MVASQRPHTEAPSATLRLHTPSKATNSQTRCWNCEEVVHRLAESCPYCKKSLQVFHISPEDKVESTLYSSQELSPLAEIPATLPDQSPNIDSNIDPAIGPSIASILLSAAALSCAGILLLLAALIWIFGDGTSFALEWPQEIWRTFSAIGILLLVLGSYILSRSE